MRDVGYNSAGIYGHPFPHAIVYGTDRCLQAKHTRLPFAKERYGDRDPELDVPLILADLGVRPVVLHDNSERWVKHLRCILELLGEAGAFEAG